MIVGFSTRTFQQCLIASLFVVASTYSAFAAVGEFAIVPAAVTLEGNFAQAQLLVTALGVDANSPEHREDFTSQAVYRSSEPAVVTVNARGQLTAVGNGRASVTVSVGGLSRHVNVTVAGVEAQPQVGFIEQVLPVLSKAGCNSGACHASQHGKGGFKLSVFSSEPSTDFDGIVRDRWQRRINRVDAANSLLVLKPTFAVPHGGGRRLENGSIGHQILTAWIAAGAPPPQPAASVTRLTVNPPRRIGQVGLEQQLQVLAIYSDGRTRDVTTWAKFDSTDPSGVTVTASGLATTRGRGLAAVMVRFEGQAAIAQFVVPYAERVELTGWQDQNFLDAHAAARFRDLGIAPSQLCDDATFLRRAYLDAIGTLPTVDESTAFLDSADQDKRRMLIDRLLGFASDSAQNIDNDQYTAYWTLKWSDLLKNSSQALGERNMWAFHNWLRESFRTNKPMDQFVRELLTAKGNPLANGPANFFLTSRDPFETGESAAQLLLGVRIACAKCHHHPFEKYGQTDYYSFAAFFTRVGTKYVQEQGYLSGQSIVFVRSSGETTAPRVGVVKPTPLDGQPTDHPVDRRIPLAEWLTAPGNNQFARNIVNRYMSYLLGRGLVDPVDDMRATNPASNPALLDALAEDFRAGGFDLKKLLRTIMNSRLYQLDSQPTPSNAADDRFYSHYPVKRLAAEPLLDAIDFAAGSQTHFENRLVGSSLPLGARAIELPDAVYSDLFLTTFGKPKRATVCECERTPDENLAQALHTLNGTLLTDKIAAPNGRIARLVAAKKSHDEIVTELYLVTLTRRPSPAELHASREFLADIGNPSECYQDLLWTLINSKPFLFNH